MIDREMNELERSVERGLALLQDLPPVAPRRECIERLKITLADEAARVLRHHRRLGRIRLGVGVAAALVLAIGLANTSTPPYTAGELAVEAALDEWAAAWNSSSDQVTGLLDGGWTSADWDDSQDQDTQVDDLFDSLDQSLSRFENL